MAKELLPDELWHEIEPLLPPHPPRTSKGGRPPVDDRDALRGILFVLKTGTPWQALPTEAFGVSGSSCWRRFDEWTDAGVWPELHRRLLNRLGKERSAPSTQYCADKEHTICTLRTVVAAGNHASPPK